MASHRGDAPSFGFVDECAYGPEDANPQRIEALLGPRRLCEPQDAN